MKRRLFLCTLSFVSMYLATSGPAGAEEFVGDAPSPGISQASGGPRSSPFEPPAESDVSFVTDAAPRLDTGCLFSSSGPIVFDVEITRHVGELNPDGTLRNASALVSEGLLSPKATLLIPAFDVDNKATPPPGFAPEVDRVVFNGELIGFLSGENNRWKLNDFPIDIRKVKFAQRGSPGSKPEGAANQVRIEIDTANAPAQVWCTSADWGAARFKAMSPIILIHGNNSNGKFFERRGFTRGLQEKHLLFDDSINLQTATIAANGASLNDKIPGIVKSFGVDSAHLVMHSKGGLDTREYLATYQPSHDSEFRVLSYTTLSTPHNGSVGADLLLNYQAAVKKTAIVRFKDFPAYTEKVTKGMPPPDAGTPDLTTSSTAAFNQANLPRLPSSIVYNTVAADADTNGNKEIDRSPDEYRELREESAALQNLDNEWFGQTKTQTVVDAAYQLLRGTASISLAYREEEIPGTEFDQTVAILTSVNGGPFGNDVLVPIPSGQGQASLQPRVTNSHVFQGAAGRNHSNVADEGAAGIVVPWIIQIEKAKGDLK